MTTIRFQSMHTTFSVGASISNPTRWKCSRNIIVDTFARCAVVGFHFTERSAGHAKCTSLFLRVTFILKILVTYHFSGWEHTSLRHISIDDGDFVEIVEIVKGFGFTYQKSIITTFYYHASVFKPNAFFWEADISSWTISNDDFAEFRNVAYAKG